MVDGQTVVCGYQVKINELPANYAVTAYHSEMQESEEETERFNNDLNNKTGYLENDEALIILADEADSTTAECYNVDDYNISYGSSVSHLDAGLVPYGVGSIAGIVFEDANENGVLDDGEQIFEGETVYLDYFVADSSAKNEDENGKSVIAAEGSFENFRDMKVETDENGAFLFDNLPILDENNQPYQYKLRMEKPSERRFTDSYDFVIMGSEKLNILLQASADDENLGTTPVILLAVPETEDNYYNLKWQIDGYNHTNAYLGISAVEISETVNTGAIPINPWMIAVPASAMGMLLLVFIVLKSRKRKETD